MPSLELNWLRTLDKTLPTPIVLFTDSPFSSGSYYFPRRQEILIQDSYFPLDRGLIAVSSTTNSVGNTLAHEFRHHWQEFHFSHNHPKAFDRSLAYHDAIVKYFTYQWWELDALLWSMDKALDEASEIWFEWLIRAKSMPTLIRNLGKFLT